MVWNRIPQQSARAELRDQPLGVPQTHEHVDLGQGWLELVPVLLHEAAESDDRRAAAFVLEAAYLEQRLDGFLLRGVDESAGIHDDDVRF